VAYKLELPPSLAGAHDIFHMSQLKKCLKGAMDVVLPEVTPLKADLTYPEHPIKILDQKARGCSTVKFLKVQSSNHSEEATWETDDFLHSCHLESKLSWREICYCSLFLLGYFSFSNLVMRFHLTWEDCDSYSVTVAATVLYSAIYGVIYSVSCLSSILNSNLFFEYYLNRVIIVACKSTSNFF
jgi:hypothetical protein